MEDEKFYSSSILNVNIPWINAHEINIYLEHLKKTYYHPSSIKLPLWDINSLNNKTQKVLDSFQFLIHNSLSCKLNMGSLILHSLSVWDALKFKGQYWYIYVCTSAFPSGSNANTVMFPSLLLSGMPGRWKQLFASKVCSIQFK